jgi:hypothetical protein
LVIASGANVSFAERGNPESGSRKILDCFALTEVNPSGSQ